MPFYFELRGELQKKTRKNTQDHSHTPFKPQKYEIL